MSFIDTDGRSGLFLTRRAELGHDQGVRTEIGEEVAGGRNVFGGYDLGQYFGEFPLDIRPRRVGAGTSVDRGFVRLRYQDFGGLLSHSSSLRKVR
jgi:hypothetical protein